MRAVGRVKRQAYSSCSGGGGGGAGGGFRGGGVVVLETGLVHQQYSVC